jgi:uncharacterized protein YabN with tetrapyrrole methylase and pyrophosphatase domain
VIASIATKLIRRHPHVFGDVQVEGAQEVLRNWETLKREERGDQPLLDHVPSSMPALLQAQSLQSRAQKASLGTVRADAATLAAALERLQRGDSTADDLGELLFGVVALARSCDIDAEDSLRRAIGRYRAAVTSEERRARQPR